MKSLILSTAVAMLLAVPAYAVEIENQDQRDYTVSLDVEPGFYIEFQLAAGQTRKNSCPDFCRVHVEGVGWVAPLSLHDKVIIKDGQMRLAPLS